MVDCIRHSPIKKGEFTTPPSLGANQNDPYNFMQPQKPTLCNTTIKITKIHLTRIMAMITRKNIMTMNINIKTIQIIITMDTTINTTMGTIVVMAVTKAMRDMGGTTTPGTIL
jgi:hypothetical protein